MKKLNRAIFCALGAGVLALTTLPASAANHHYRGRIVSFADRGVNLRVNGSVTYVPWSGYSFYIDGAPIGGAQDLAVGTLVDAYTQSDTPVAQTYPTQQYPATPVPVESAVAQAQVDTDVPPPTGPYSPTYSTMGPDDSYQDPNADYDYPAGYPGYTYNYDPSVYFGLGFGWPYWGGYYGHHYYNGYRGGFNGYRGGFNGFHGSRFNGYRGGGGSRSAGGYPTNTFHGGGYRGGGGYHGGGGFHGGGGSHGGGHGGHR